MKIAIVDYGMGNIRSLKSALLYLGVSDIILSSDFAALKICDKIILPGVGAFSLAMDEIHSRNLQPILHELVHEYKKPFFGICLGMQLLANSSVEGIFTKGLGLINAEVNSFQSQTIKVPHVGANRVDINRDAKLFKGLGESADFYFTHSYRMTSDEAINQSMCTYGDKFIAAFEKDNIAGAQFHPELSQKNGLRMIKNFIEEFY